MNNFCCMYPVEVFINESAISGKKFALMYSIYPDEAGVPCGTCWLPDTCSWLTLPLSEITPKLDVVKKVKLID